MKFEAIGTYWSIETSSTIDGALQEQISQRIEDFDKTYSRFRNDSIVAEIARAGGTYAFPDDSTALIDFYRRLYDITQGVVTPLIGDVLNALGYDKDYSFVRKETKEVIEWDQVMTWDGVNVTTKRAITLDFGAAGKGYLADIIAGMLEKNGISEYVVDASGDVRQRGSQEQVIGLEDPRDPSRVIGVATLKNASLCASATNRRSWGDGLHHVVNGLTGQTAGDITATWVIAETTMIADGIATALFFVSPESLRQLGPFEFVRMHNDGKVEHSRHFVGELFL